MGLNYILLDQVLFQNGIKLFIECICNDGFVQGPYALLFA